MTADTMYIGSDRGGASGGGYGVMVGGGIDEGEDIDGDGPAEGDLCYAVGGGWHPPKPGGYWGGGWNPLNWRRWVYTTDPRAPDVVYDAAIQGAGDRAGRMGVGVSYGINGGRGGVSLGGFQGEVIINFGTGDVTYYATVEAPSVSPGVSFTPASFQANFNGVLVDNIGTDPKNLSGLAIGSNANIIGPGGVGGNWGGSQNLPHGPTVYQGGLSFGTPGASCTPVGVSGTSKPVHLGNIYDL